MENIDLMVIRAAHEWLASGHRVVLATVVRTWGSSPRPVGSMMVLREDGKTVGSVSGGCIEDDLVCRYTTVNGPVSYPDSSIDIVLYGVDADEAHRFGLPCGGTIELVLEFLPAIEVLSELVERLKRGELVRRSLCLVRNLVRLDSADKPEELHFDGARLSCTLGPGYRMLLIGAGTLTEYVATMALFNGFSVTVCDPRRDRLHAPAQAGVQIVTDMPDDAVIAFRPDSRSCIVALSHDPKLDDLALLEALHSTAFYVGAIGSRANNDARRERLITHFSETEASLARLSGPIGIYIGSKTPAEIAVSVMAEILAVKNGVNIPREMSVAVAKRRDAR
ncbi:XdhC family protein [Paraburkholderia sp. JHI869]|uniref:XdhC family protein n=1 Tax=Paraburkholderia sp. JHI869 TaxID=3112959 RepID=UPI00317B69AB